MKRYRVTIDGRIYDVEIDDPKARPVTARLAGVAYSVEVDPVRDSAATDASDEPPAATTGETGPPTSPSGDATGHRLTDRQSLTAPIPGVVSEVAISVGDEVGHGDELLTIEAMKMFNVIRSPWSAVVATVHVAPGKRVAQGEPLVTFAPV